MLSFGKLPRKTGAFLITMYQKTLSFDHGPLRMFYPHGFCKFYPTCSEYTKQYMGRFGLFLGVVYGIKRIFRCHPWSEGGVDHPPKKVR